MVNNIDYRLIINIDYRMINNIDYRLISNIDYRMINNIDYRMIINIDYRLKNNIDYRVINKICPCGSGAEPRFKLMLALEKIGASARKDWCWCKKRKTNSKPETLNISNRC